MAGLDDRDLDPAGGGPPVERIEEDASGSALHVLRERFVDDDEKVEVALRPVVAACRQGPVQVDAGDPLVEEVAELGECPFDPLPHVGVGIGPALSSAGRMIDGGAGYVYGTQVG